MSTRRKLTNRVLGVWIGVTLVAGLFSAVTTVEAGGQPLAVGAAPDDGAPKESAFPRDATTTTASVPASTTGVSTPTTTAVVVETTMPPTTMPPTTVPSVAPKPEVTQPGVAQETTAVPSENPLQLSISFGPEIYPANGLPMIHVRGTGCTGPGHTEGGREYIWSNPLQPGQYGASYLYTDLAGTWLIRMDPMRAQPQSGDWEVTIPPEGGKGDFLVSASCVNDKSTAQPWGSSPSWSNAVVEYPATRFTMPA